MFSGCPTRTLFDAPGLNPIPAPVGFKSARSAAIAAIVVLTHLERVRSGAGPRRWLVGGAGGVTAPNRWGGVFRFPTCRSTARSRGSYSAASPDSEADGVGEAPAVSTLLWPHEKGIRIWKQYEQKIRSMAGHLGAVASRRSGRGRTRLRRRERIEQTSDEPWHQQRRSTRSSQLENKARRVGGGSPENNRRAKFYRITRVGPEELTAEVKSGPGHKRSAARCVKDRRMIRPAPRRSKPAGGQGLEKRRS